VILTGLDLATRLCGWCTGDGSTIPAANVFKLPQVGADIGWMLDVFDTALNLHIDAYKPEAIVFEAPILVVKGRNGSGRTDKLEVIRKIYNVEGHLEFVCRRRGIPCHEVSLRAIKKEVTGNHLADKDAMMVVARRVGINLPPGEGAKDAADAWGAWLLALRHYNKPASGKWDSRIWGRRGGLL
jgi:Holliday junction resolvasome RuvABC endonuclease subunit